MATLWLAYTKARAHSEVAPLLEAADTDLTGMTQAADADNSTVVDGKEAAP